MRLTDKRGSATLLTLLISAVILTVGIGFNWIVKEHLKVAEGLKNKAGAMLKTTSAFNSLMYSIPSADINRKEIVFTSGKDVMGIRSIPLNGSAVAAFEDVNIKIQDSNGMLSIANLFTPAMERLVKIVQPDNKMTPAIIDSFLDWTDPDGLSRNNGAEDSFYKTEGRQYTARNYPMQYKDELGFIRGMDAELYKKISPFVTLLPNSGFNPNTASDELLMAYIDIDRGMLASLRDYMSKNVIISDAEVFGVTGKAVPTTSENINFMSSRFWDITISSGSPKPVYSIEAGVDARQMPLAPYSVMYWKEE